MSEYEGMTKKEMIASERDVPLHFDDWFGELDADTVREFIHIGDHNRKQGLKEGIDRTICWASGAMEQEAAIDKAYRKYCDEVNAGERGA